MNDTKLNEYLKTTLFSFLVVLSIILIHFLFPSMINGHRWPLSFDLEVASDYLRNGYIAHRDFAPFSKRPFMTLLITMFHSLGISVYMSYLIAIFSALFCSILSIKYLLRSLGIKSDKASLWLYILTFCNVLILFKSNYTYDEPLQFLFLFLFLSFFMREKVFGSIFFLSLSIVARDSALLLLPGLFLWKAIDSKKVHWKNCISLVVPVLIYFTYSYFWFSKDMDGRFFHWQFNFESVRVAVTSIASFFLGLGPIGFIAFKISKSRYNNDQKFLKYFWLTVLLNAIVVLVATRANEVRLFCLPIVLCVPFLEKWWGLLRFNIPIFSKRLVGELFLLLVISFAAYNPYDASWGPIFQFYLFCLLVFAYLLKKAEVHDH